MRSRIGGLDNTQSVSRTPEIRIKIIRLLLVSLTVALCSGGCGRIPPGPGNAGPISIGYFGDLSGPTFNFGQSAKNGVLMAADEINQGGGINGRRIDVVIEDDQGNAEQAAARAGKLI